MAAGGTDRNPVEVLSEEFLERIRRGEAVTPEEYAEKHPDLADEILALFPALLMMEDLGDETSDRTSSIAGEPARSPARPPAAWASSGCCARWGAAAWASCTRPSRSRSAAAWRSRSCRPGRSPTPSRSAASSARPARPRGCTIRTSCPIFGVGEHEGTHYYVMQFIQGQGLDAVLAELKKLRDARAAKSIRAAPRRADGRAAAAADIARSLVTGRFVPGAGTAGLCRPARAPRRPGALRDAAVPSSARSSRREHRGGEQHLGRIDPLRDRPAIRPGGGADRGPGGRGARPCPRPGHPPPRHQAVEPAPGSRGQRLGDRLRPGQGDRRRGPDAHRRHRRHVAVHGTGAVPRRGRRAGGLYALGLTLYELLALRPAFDETDRASLIRQVTQEDPPRLRRLNRHVPPDLETIIHKAIARDPGQRMQTARALGRRPAALPRRAADPGAAGLDDRAALSMGPAEPGAGDVARPVRRCCWWRRPSARSSPRPGSATSPQAARSPPRTRTQRGSQADTPTAAERPARSRGPPHRRRRPAASRPGEPGRIAGQPRPGAQGRGRLIHQGQRKRPVERARACGRSAAICSNRPWPSTRSSSAAAATIRASWPTWPRPRRASGRSSRTWASRIRLRAALRRAAELYDKTLAARPDDVALLERQSEVWHRLGDLDYRTDKPTANAAYRKAIAIRERLAAAHPAEPRFRMALSRSFNGLAISTRRRRRDPRRVSPLAGAAAEAGRRDPGGSRPAARPERVVPQPGGRALERRTSGRGGRADDARDRLRPRRRGASAARPGIRVGPRGRLQQWPPDYIWQLGRRDEALALSAEGIAFLRKLSAENPDVRSYRDALANAIAARSRYLAGARADRRGRLVGSRGGRDPGDEAGPGRRRPGDRRVLSGSHRRGRWRATPRRDEFTSWPEAARREADLAVADLRAAVARGFRRADIIRADSTSSRSLTRDDVKSLLAEMERPAGRRPRLAKAEAPAAAATPSPLDRPGRLEEDRFLGELTIGLLSEDDAEPDRARARLEAMLDRIEARRKSGPDSPGLEPFAQSIRLRLGEQLWKAGKLAEARRLWDDVLAPMRRLPADDRGRQAILSSLRAGDAADQRTVLRERPLGAGRRIRRVLSGRRPRGAFLPLL